MKVALVNAKCEIDKMEGLTESLQHAVGELLQVEGAPSGARQELQKLDLLHQSLGALASYLSSLSQQTPGEWQIASHMAIADIKLRDMAERLSGEGEAPQQLQTVQPLRWATVTLFD